MNELATILPEIEKVEAKLLTCVQPVTFLKHHFQPGVYIREIWMPKGSIILGHAHKTEHLNIITQGRALVAVHGVVTDVRPGCFISGVGVRKALLIMEDTVWLTVHANPTNERDVAKLEDLLISKSSVWQEYEHRMVEESFRAEMEART